MPAIAAHETLGTLVVANPGLAEVFERLGLDYCCGGGRTLAEACQLAGLDLARVVGVLDQVREAAPEPWTTLGPAELVDHLERTHHRYLWEELPRLSALTAKIAEVHGERHPELLDVEQCYGALRADLEPHLRKEEQVLFPLVRQLAAASTAPSLHCGTLANPISVMRREHDAVGELLVRLRLLTAGYRVPDDGCASYEVCYRGLARLEADTHLHVHKESNVLFPSVLALEERLAALR